MPTYEYCCEQCSEHIEVVQSFNDDPLETCALCGGNLRKVFHPVGIVFKGSGFYVNDSRGSKSQSVPSKSDSAEKESSAPQSSSSEASSGAKNSGSTSTETAKSA